VPVERDERRCVHDLDHPRVGDRRGEATAVGEREEPVFGAPCDQRRDRQRRQLRRRRPGVGRPHAGGELATVAKDAGVPKRRLNERAEQRVVGLAGREHPVGERRAADAPHSQRLDEEAEAARRPCGQDHALEGERRELVEAVAVGEDEPADPLRPLGHEHLADGAARVVADERHVV
jgi:hypothetical protein